jgi:MYXO-CTERM domain-containing protein
MLKTARPALFTLVAVGASLAAAAPAKADVSSGISCDTSLDCSSKGKTTLHAESRAPIMSTIGTGWLPACPNAADAHCSDQNIQVAVSLDLAALKTPSTEPLWSVDMQGAAIVNAAWPTPSAFELTAPAAATSDGIFKVTHTLVPSFKVYAALGPFKKEWTYDVPQESINANFNYKASNTVLFAPWALEQPTINLVPPPAATSSVLISKTVVDNSDIKMSIGLAAQTNPTFTYRTTKVQLQGATTITKDTLVGNLPMVDADFLELKADVEGEVTVKGEMRAEPYVSIDRLGNLPTAGALELSYKDTPIKKAYTNEYPVAVKFPSVTVRIALPNVKVQKSLDMSTAQVGQRSEATVVIPNSGELAAKLKVESSDPQFTVEAPLGVDAKAQVPMKVRFAPTKEGEQTATITVRSTDPDSPVQTISVRAQASAVPVPPAEEPKPVAAGPLADSGCGCRTAAPASTSTSPLAALAGFAVALGLVARRRRSA